MTDCVIEIDLTVPVAGGGTAPATGYIQFRPTKRRDLEGEIVLPESFNVQLVDGAAEVTLAPTVDGDWCWRATERISKGRNWYFNVPDGPGPVDYDDLEEVDKDTLNPSAPIVPVWKGYIDAGDAALQAQIDALESGGVDSVAGLNGTVTAAGLKTALNLPADTAGDLLNEVVLRMAADDDLDLAITAEATARETADAARLSGAAVSTDGSQSLPAPTGVGLEFVIVDDALDDIRLNGVSL